MVFLLSNGRAFVVYGGQAMRASELSFKRDYPSFPEFAQYELPLHLVNAEVVSVLQRLRDMSGIPITPSPVPEGWARTSGSVGSRHYAVGRLSDAGDVFPARGRLLECWIRAQQIQEIGGLGLYIDTNGPDGLPWPMMHLDLRQTATRTFWIRTEKIAYHYLHSSPVTFWRMFKHTINSGG